MTTPRFILLWLVLVLTINWWLHTEGKTAVKQEPSGNALIQRHKRVVDPISVIGLVVSVAAAIQSAVCTFSDICGGDELTKKLDALEQKLEVIESDVKAIKKEVEEIWEESKRKWYFKHIDYIINERRKVIRDLKNKDNSALAKERRSRFINEVLGGAGNDEYVEKALFHIPGLVIKEQFVTHYYSVQTGTKKKSREEAAKLTWVFVRKLFRYQEDGYASVILASSMKYKEDETSYNSSMGQVCAWWSKSRDPEYRAFCEKFIKDPDSQDRRKIQNDYLFSLRDLAFFPVQQLQSDCQNFRDSAGLHTAAGLLFVSQLAAKAILVVNKETLGVVKTINLPGSQCGENCHPFDISIHAANKVMAVAAHNQPQGGKSYVLMYKINGDFNNPSGLSIQHYYTMLQLFHPGGKNPDVRSVAFCGDRFAYADYNGAIYNWRMRWDDSNPVPDLWDRYDWYINRYINIIKGNIHHIDCSASGKSWVLERSYSASSQNGVGTVPADITARYADKVLDELADIVVNKDSWNDVNDHRSRLNIIKGIGMDAKRNLFYSSPQYGFSNSVGGLYQRTYDGKRRYIREWNHVSGSNKMDFFDMAVDDSGFFFLIQKYGPNGNKCLHKYHHEIDLEDNIA